MALFLFTQDAGVSPITNKEVAAKERNITQLQEVLLKATRLPAVSSGLALFFSKRFKSLSEESDNVKEFVLWACETSREIFKTAPTVSREDVDY